ncbi:MAG: copper chaperone PCu(A)C [Thermotogae bacterium]|nr:copper chaperone PCu(A)C [Thermotogota bacterium]
MLFVLGLTVSNAWARPGMKGGNSAAYFIVINESDKPDTLYGAAVKEDIVSRVEIHETYDAGDGKMGMRHIPYIVIPPKGRMVFRPGGYHIMLIGLKKTLAEGDKFTLVLKFKRAGEIVVKDVEVHVSPPEEFKKALEEGKGSQKPQKAEHKHREKKKNVR